MTPPQQQPWYPPPGYGSAPPWPHGPGRPGLATAAAVLGFVAGGLSALWSLVLLGALVSGDVDLVTVLLVVSAVVSAAGLITGGVLLLRRSATRALFTAALFAVVSLVACLLVGIATQDGPARVGVVGFVALALPLPVLVAVFPRLPRVTGWSDATRPR